VVGLRHSARKTPSRGLVFGVEFGSGNDGCASQPCAVPALAANSDVAAATAVGIRAVTAMPAQPATVVRTIEVVVMPAMTVAVMSAMADADRHPRATEVCPLRVNGTDLLVGWFGCAGRRTGKACHRRWNAYGTSSEYSDVPLHTRRGRCYGASGEGVAPSALSNGYRRSCPHVALF
jgi:hypothetical protein